MALKLSKDSKVVMIGDSITDSGRARPVGEGMNDALGRGYVALVDALIGASFPSHQVRIVNMGSSGNTVRDLQERWQADVLDLRPDWVSIMIGINDVWRQFDRPVQTELHVYPEEYEATLDNIVARTASHVRGIVLMTPYYIEPNREDAMRALMDRYGVIVGKIANKHDTIFVDTQAAIDEFITENYPGSIAWDRVHPNLTGHMVLARAFLKSIGYDWN